MTLKEAWEDLEVLANDWDVAKNTLEILNDQEKRIKALEASTSDLGNVTAGLRVIGGKLPTEELYLGVPRDFAPS